MMTALKAGGTLEYDETTTDSTVLPASLSDSSASFKSNFTNKRTSTWHVVVTVPDSTIPYFKVVRTLTAPSQRDTSASRSSRTAKTVAYGTSYSEYDPDGSLLHTATITTADTADLSGLPLNAIEALTVTDSMRTALVSQMQAAGQTVTTLGSGEIVSQATMADSSSMVAKAYFLPSTFQQDSIVVTANGLPYYSAYCSYSSQGGLKIGSSQIEIQYNTLNTTRQSAIGSHSAGLDLSYLYQSAQVKITSLSNIQLP